MNALSAVSVLAATLASQPAQRPQTFENLSIEIEGRRVTATGGEQPSVAMFSGPLVIGNTTTAVLSQSACALGIKPAGSIDAGAFSGWHVEATPAKVVGDAVTFRLRWGRRGHPTEPRAQVAEREVTLKPGESLPIELVPYEGNLSGCDMSATLLRVGVSYWPRPDHDRRLLLTELFLIERMPDGTENSQTVSMRTMFNTPTQFFFEGITDGATLLDFFGEFTTVAEAGAFVMKLETRSRLVQGGTIDRSSLVLPIDGRFFGPRRVQATLHLKPNDVVALELPRLSENEVGAFANRRYSIRVRTRQIR